MKEFEFLTKDIVDIKSVIDLNKIYANPSYILEDDFIENTILEIDPHYNKILYDKLKITLLKIKPTYNDILWLPLTDDMIDDFLVNFYSLFQYIVPEEIYKKFIYKCKDKSIQNLKKDSNISMHNIDIIIDILNDKSIKEKVSQKCLLCKNIILLFIIYIELDYNIEKFKEIYYEKIEHLVSKNEIKTFLDKSLCQNLNRSDLSEYIKKSITNINKKIKSVKLLELDINKLLSDFNIFINL